MTLTTASETGKCLQNARPYRSIVNEIKKLRRSEYNYGVYVGREEERAKGASGIIQICMKSGISQDDALKHLWNHFQSESRKLFILSMNIGLKNSTFS